MKRPPSPRLPRGITLVEVLIAVGIVSVLTMLILPAGRRALESARGVKSMGNLRTLHAAVMAYAAENNGVFSPPTAYTAAIRPYLAQSTPEERRMQKMVFVSPNIKTPIPAAGGSGTLAEDPRTYSMNLLFAVDDPLQKIPFARVSRPGEVILLADGAQGPTFRQSSAHTLLTAWHQAANRSHLDALLENDTDEDGTAAGERKFGYRNNGKALAVFVDGHVGAFGPGEMKYRNLIPE